jgi:UPF0755 protein
MRRLPLILLSLAFFCVLAFVFIFVPIQVERNYGHASPRLSLGQRYQYALRLFWHDGILTAQSSASTQFFTVAIGESPIAVADRLEATGIILSAEAFLDYLVFTGLDTSLQSGDYHFDANLSIIDVARAMQDSTPTDVTFVVLPGWRMEEIAASLPTSGLDATPDAFLSAARTPLNFPFLEGVSTNEGFLLPDAYILPRAADADALLAALVRNFANHLTPELETGFSNQGLTVYQAVILASIIERESIVADEMPLIASVFFNRINYGWKLQSDPTVQYAIGFDGNWWPNPLSAFDLDFDSPYNTYLYAGLPPAPISNPSMDALRAVANPALSDYFFFRARCDGSGLHNFSVTLEEHINNECQ